MSLWISITARQYSAPVTSAKLKQWNSLQSQITQLQLQNSKDLSQYFLLNHIFFIKIDDSRLFFTYIIYVDKWNGQLCYYALRVITDVWQKTTKFCKEIILQLKKKKAFFKSSYWTFIGSIPNFFPLPSILGLISQV